MILSGGLNDYTFNSNNSAALLHEDRQVFSYFNNKTNNDNHFSNYGINLNLKHTFDSTGRELTVDADYATYDSKTNQHLHTAYRYADGTPQGDPNLLYGRLNGNTSIHSLKADYVHPLKHDARVEAGFKTSFVTADNDPAFYDQSTGVDIYDSSKSNHFIYKENINAVYVNANKDWKKWSVQLGLRAEQTIANGHQLVNDSRFEKDYTNLFPNLAVTHHLDAKNDIGLTLGRRIDRPNYRQLNPFRDYLDPTSIHEGNPYLNPSFTYTAEVSHIYQGKFITQFNYSRTTDVITQVIVPSDNNVTLITDRNLATNTVYTISGSYPLQLYKWWNSTNYIAGYYSHFDGDIANTALSAGTFAATISTQNTFVLPNDWSLELSGWYQSRQRYGYMVLKAMSGINIGVQKNFLDKKATVRLNFTDLMLKQNPVGSSDFTGYHEDFIVRRDTRTANISFTYRLGKRTIAPARKRQRGAEEELKRAGNNGA